MNTQLIITKPLILSGADLTLRNIIKKQFRRELFNKHLVGALAPNTTEYKSESMSNKFGHDELNLPYLHNGLLEARDEQYKTEVLEQQQNNVSVSIRQLKKYKTDEHLSQIEQLKALRDECKKERKFKLIKEINADIHVLEYSMNPIQSRNDKSRYVNDFDEWNMSTVKASLKQLLFLSEQEIVMHGLFELRDVLLRTDFTDIQRASLYLWLNNINIGNHHKDLKCCIEKLVNNLNNHYKETMKRDIIPDNTYLLQ